MSSERYRLIVDLQLLVIKDGKILLKRRRGTDYYPGHYELVAAGHLEENEPVSVAMAREAEEEIGITIQPSHLTCVQVMHRKDTADQRVSFFFVASAYEGEPAIMEPDKADDMRWFALNELPAMIPYHKAGIESYLKDQYYVEFNW